MEPTGHVVSALPYLILLLCPLIFSVIGMGPNIIETNRKSDRNRFFIMVFSRCMSALCQRQTSHNLSLALGSNKRANLTGIGKDHIRTVAHHSGSNQSRDILFWTVGARVRL